MWKGHLIFISVLAMLEIRLASNFSVTTLCTLVPGLTWRQKQICMESPHAFVALAEGYRMGSEECQHQFEGYRWNCSQVWQDDVFTHVIQLASREAAYTYAIASAGAAYAVTAACARGKISNCGCAPHPKPGKSRSKGSGIKLHKTDLASSNSHTLWKWGGCSVDIEFGMRYAKKFLDAREVEENGRALMNLHNNRAGRRILKNLLRTECKCHGISGSCSLKTCWKTLPPFRVLGNVMMRRYEKAKSVLAVKSKRGLRLILTKHSRMGRKVFIPKRLELVYLESSPNYCESNNKTGILGTVGRTCNSTLIGPHSCDLLCCGRGYHMRQIKQLRQCNCKFKWCCEVECEVCEENHKEFTCK